ncbi:hypothetical protein MKX03_010832 [Papaver bracteatum]|nr:hypothetical protein MKX03_010832 [Papaver bracteatum]
MLVEMRDSYLPVALGIYDEETSSDVTPVLGPLHKVPGSQQKTGTFNWAPKRPSQNAVPDSEVNSHGSNKDEVVPLKNLDSLCSDWFNRNMTPTKYKFKCVVNAIGKLKFDNRTKLQCLVDVDDGSCWASVYIPQKMVEEKIGRSAQEVYDAFHSGLDLYDEILDLLKRKLLCGFQCTMLVAMTDSFFPVALEIYDEDSQQETEISGGESNVESRVAAGLAEIG